MRAVWIGPQGQEVTSKRIIETGCKPWQLASRFAWFWESLAWCRRRLREDFGGRRK